MRDDGDAGRSGKLIALIAAAVLIAFVASHLYVFGFSLGIHQSLVSYFAITDYLQTTPSWALPAIYSALVACALPVFEETWRRKHLGTTADGVNRPPAVATATPPVRILSWKVGAFYLAIGVIMLVAFKVLRVQNDILPRLLIVVGISWLLAAFSDNIVGAFQEVMPGRVLFDDPGRTIVAAALVALCFALVYGFLVAPKLMALTREVTVNLSPLRSPIEDRTKTERDRVNVSQSEREAKVNGRIVLTLPDQVILQTTGPSPSFIVLPKVRIASIEVPFVVLKPVTTVAPPPTPALTPAITPTSTAAPTSIPTLTPAATPTLTPAPTSTPALTPTATPTPTLTAAPTPTLTPPPAATSAPPLAAPITPLPDQAHMSKADRRRVQDKLNRLGYYQGRVDGGFGPSTRAAIRRFQHDIGVKTTGHLTAEEANRLIRAL